MSDSTIVRILRGVPLDKDYLNTLSWGTLQEQISYFESKQVDGLTGSYQRQTGVDDVVRFNAPIDSIMDCNYIMYQNSEQSDKWYFGFIDKLVHKNSDVTEVQFTVDWLQTYYFEFSLNPCFVEREHVSDDSIGLHTVEEGLELGEFVHSTVESGWSINGNKTDIFNYPFINNTNDDEWYGKLKYWIVVGCSCVLTDGVSELFGTDLYGLGQLNQNYISAYPYWGTELENASHLADVISRINEMGKIESIISMFLVPEFFIIKAPNNEVPGGNNGIVKMVKYANPNVYFTMKKNFSYLGEYDGDDTYYPKNNKLFTYPFNKLYGTNNQGQFCEYKFEMFNDDASFRVISGLGEAMKPMVYPTNYKKGEPCLDYSLSLPCYSQLAWNSDTFAAWFAQNGAQMAVNIGSGIVMTVVGAATGNPLLAIAGVSAVTSQLTEVHKAEIAPPSVGGNSGGTTLVTNNAGWFTFERLTIRAERAKIIDDYFSMYGYKINRVKVPNIRTRPQWNYVKTHDVTLKGNIPTVADTVIKKCFNSGITFWRNPANVGNYNLANK